MVCSHQKRPKSEAKADDGIQRLRHKYKRLARRLTAKGLSSALSPHSGRRCYRLNAMRWVWKNSGYRMWIPEKSG